MKPAQKQLDRAFSNVTAIPRKAKVIPKEASTPKRTVAILRRKKKTQSSSVFGTSLETLQGEQQL